MNIDIAKDFDDEFRSRIEELFGSVYTGIARILRLDEDLVIEVAHAKNPDALVDLEGVGGYCPSAKLVRLSFDVDHSAYPLRSLIQAKKVLVHELYHAARLNAGVDSATLYDVAVNEGLADRFVFEALGEQSLWLSRMSEASEYLSVFDKEKGLGINEELYARWFLGAEDIPQWVGYGIGYVFAGEIMENTGRSTIELVGHGAH